MNDSSEGEEASMIYEVSKLGASMLSIASSLLGREGIFAILLRLQQLITAEHTASALKLNSRIEIQRDEIGFPETTSRTVFTA